MRLRSLHRSAVQVGFVFYCAGLGLAESFTGTFSAETSDGQNILSLTQSGNQVSGTYTVSNTQLAIYAPITAGKVTGTAVLVGTPVKFFVSFWFDGAKLLAEITEEGEDGNPDPETTERITFARIGGGGGTDAARAPAQYQAAPGSSELLDAEALRNVAVRVKANFARDDHPRVLAQGNPPLTQESVAAFAELLRLTFQVEMTEAEFEATSRHFIEYYEKGDAQTKAMLAGGWQNILVGLQNATAAEREKGIQEVHDVMAQRFAGGAQAGMPWAVAMNATIQRRQATVAKIEGTLPDYAKQADLHQQMTEADLDASLEMLYFMWVACGRDASLVTEETVAGVRILIVQNFATFPPQVQYVFANAQKVYSSLRGQWAQATPQFRAQMAQSFALSLDQLGLTVPSGGGDSIQAGGAWADMNGKSHGEWAADMVQGLAGSSYHSSW